jgi:O-antigen/teichoic acid export membrane protein
MLAFLFPPLLLPMFSSLQDKFGELVNLLKLSFSLMWTLVVVASATCYAFRHEIMELLYVQADRYWGDVFGVLILNFFWMGLIHIFGTFVTASGRMRTANWIFFSCILLNIGLNLLLIPGYKAWGAAVTTFVTQGAVAVGLSIVIRQHLYQQSFLGTFLKGCVFVGIVILLSWGLSVLPGIHWTIRFGASILAGILSAFLIEFLDRKQLINSFIRSKQAQ